MSKRAAVYATQTPDWDRITKPCGVCGLDVCVNNWPDHKPRTPKMFDFVLCVDCDPRHIDDRYKKEGYRILHRRRMRILNMARIVRALAKIGCLRDGADGCKCPGCAARKLFG